MSKTKMVIVALGGLLLAFAIGALLYSAQRADQSVPVAEVNRTALVRMHSPALGPADAPVVIVEFIDPACETCAAFFPLVKDMLAAHPGKIRLVLRYAPFHRGSDQVVALLEAARMQGKYWPTLEALLATQARWAPNHTVQVALAWEQVGGLGLDLDRLRADMARPEIAQLMAQDLADARTLRVTMTPEYFVNGKPLPSFGYEQLRQMVADALGASAGP